MNVCFLKNGIIIKFCILVVIYANNQTVEPNINGMARYIVTQRNRYPLVLIETAGISIFSAYWLCKRYGWDWIIGIAIFIVCIAVIGAMFFRFRVFRYFFSIAFSLFWGFLAFVFASSASKSDFSHWIAFILVFVISIFIHRSYFYIETDSERIKMLSFFIPLTITHLIFSGTLGFLS